MQELQILILIVLCDQTWPKIFLFSHLVLAFGDYEGGVKSWPGQSWKGFKYITSAFHPKKPKQTWCSCFCCHKTHSVVQGSSVFFGPVGILITYTNFY